MKIENQNILITGANRGIGLEIARAAARKKAILHLVLRKEQNELQEELIQLGAQNVIVLISDLSHKESVTKLAKQLSDQKIDILINNAGLLTGGLFEEQPLNDIYDMFQVNLLSAIQLTQALLPGMIACGHGKIVNNSSVSAYMHFPCASTYAASKAAISAFADCLSIELEGTGVSTLTLITPGIKTRMFDQIEVKYGKNLNTPMPSISAQTYADQVISAIEDESLYLTPKGSTGLGLKITKHFPRLFRWEVKRHFKR